MYCSHGSINIGTDAHTHAHTHTCTCLQPPLHRFTQCQHIWVASDSHHNVTDSHQCVQSALSSQAQMQLLILLCWVPSTCDVPLITFINDIVMQKVTNNSLSIHFLNEPAAKLVQDFLSCMERAESWYTNQTVLFIVGPHPLTLLYR